MIQLLKDCSKAHLWLLLGLVIGSRLIAYLTFGLLEMPDSSGYTEYADYILATPDWMERADYVFRMVGLPVVIAFLKEITRDHWGVLLFLLQLSASVLATSLLYVATVSLFEKAKTALIVSVLYSFSILYFLDLTILTDSLVSHSFTSIFCLFILIFQGHITRAALTLFICGLLFAGAFMLREGSFFLIVPTLPLLAVVLWKLKTRHHPIYLIICAALYIAPLFSAQNMMLNWNEARTGERFVTTGARTVYTYALMNPYLTLFPDLFEGDSTLDKAFRETVTEDSFDAIVTLNTHLMAQEGWSEVDIIAAGQRKYLSAFIENPLLAPYLMAINIKPNTIFSLFQPVLALSQMTSISQGHFDYWRARFIAFDLIKNPTLFKACLVLILIAESLLTLFIFCLCVFILPVLIFGRFKKAGLGDFITSKEGLFLGLGLLYIGFWMIHALVHLEARYHAGVNMVILLGSLYVLQHYHHRLPPKVRSFLF